MKRLQPLLSSFDTFCAVCLLWRVAKGILEVLGPVIPNPLAFVPHHSAAFTIVGECVISDVIDSVDCRRC